jgi:hypothetical protein
VGCGACYLVGSDFKGKGNFIWLPNFAYNLMADRIHDDDLEELKWIAFEC